jgi:hypothetical protein
VKELEPNQNIPVANLGNELEEYHKEVAKAICNDVRTHREL